MPFKNKNFKRAYDRKWKQVHKEENRFQIILSNIKTRCTNPNTNCWNFYGGKGIQCLLTIKDIEKLWNRDHANLMKKPSINRKNNDGNYTFKNCEFIEMSLNTAERNKRIASIPILQFDLENNFIKEWPSAMEVKRTLGFDNSYIQECAYGKYSHAYKFIWRFK